jgi:hypothetical protein
MSDPGDAAATPTPAMNRRCIGHAPKSDADNLSRPGAHENGLHLIRRPTSSDLYCSAGGRLWPPRNCRSLSKESGCGGRPLFEPKRRFIAVRRNVCNGGQTGRSADEVRAAALGQTGDSRPNEIERVHALFADGLQQTVWLKERLARPSRSGAPGRFLEQRFQSRPGGLPLRLLAESHFERRIGEIQAQAHQCDDDGNEEETETDSQHMFRARRTRLAGKCVQDFLLSVRVAQ